MITDQRIKDLLHARLDRRTEQFLDRVTKLKRWIDAGKEGGEEDRIWLEQFTNGKVGLDICCGDFVIGDNSYGVDPAEAEREGVYPLLGATYMLREDDVMQTFKNQELDYIVCNYFDALPNPLASLFRWQRALKKEGVIAFIVRDSDSPEYSEGAGPLNNHNRLNCFNKSTIKHYLVRAEFDVKIIEPCNTSIRCMAVKH